MLLFLVKWSHVYQTLFNDLCNFCSAENNRAFYNISIVIANCYRDNLCLEFKSSHVYFDYACFEQSANPLLFPTLAVWYQYDHALTEGYTYDYSWFSRHSCWQSASLTRLTSFWSTVIHALVFPAPCRFSIHVKR